MDWLPNLIAYLTTVALGGTIGAIELATRYRDQPGKLVTLPSAWLYVLVNAGASAAALLLAHTFKWDFGVSSNARELITVQVLVCSFGAMAVFRSAIAVVKIGDQYAAIGPDAILSSFLAIADRAVDRIQGSRRSTQIALIMQDVSFEKAKKTLPTFCLALLRNVPSAEQLELGNAIDALAADSDMSDAVKSWTLGLLIMNLSGPGLLRTAVDTLHAEIKATAADNLPDPNQ